MTSCISHIPNIRVNGANIRLVRQDLKRELIPILYRISLAYILLKEARGTAIGVDTV